VPETALPDILTVSVIAVGVSLLVGGLSVVALAAMRRSSIVLQLAVLIVSSHVSVVASMTVAARLMFLSYHDLEVGVRVAVISGSMSLLIVGLLGLVVTRNARSLSATARGIGSDDAPDLAVDAEDTRPTGRPYANAELAALANELTATSLRLRESREREHRLDAARRELVAGISHDLRTPLAGIRAMAEALEDSLADDPRRYYSRIREQAEQLGGMVDDLFELSKIDSGGLVLDFQRVSLYDLVSDAVAGLRVATHDRPITFEAAPGEELAVFADPRALSRAVTNLLLNAIQHTPEGSPITVTASIVDGQASVAVIDSGEGISRDDLARVFEPGWRGSAARTPPTELGASGSAGLGLAIARGIAVAHRGDVSVRNVAGGCRFDLLFPQDAARVA
jgi:signal transduction histidine kinase